jgi:hypothetical protein
MMLLIAVAISTVVGTNSESMFASQGESLTSLQATGNTTVDAVCMMKHCGIQSSRAMTDAKSVKAMLCANKCMNNWDEDSTPQKLIVQNCSNTCLTSYGDEIYCDYMNCMSEHDCIAFPPIEDTCPAPKPHPTLKIDDLEGTWWAVAGMHPLYDCYDCDRWTVRRLNSTHWVAEISYAGLTVAGDVQTERVQWPVRQTEPGEPIAGRCQGCFVKGMPHGETWYLLDAAKDGRWIAMNYCGDTMNWRYHGALVLAKEQLRQEDVQLLQTAFNISVGAQFPEAFCKPAHDTQCAYLEAGREALSI